MRKNIEILRIVVLLLLALAGLTIMAHENFALYKNKPDFIMGINLPYVITTALILTIFLLDNIIHKYEQLEKVAELNHAIKTQRHDFVQHIQVIHSLIELECYREAQTYIKKYFKEISILTELNKLDNKEIAVLLLSKQTRAHKNNIIFDIEVDANLQKLPISTIQFNSLIGNIIDNAIEAAVEYKNDKRLRIEITELPDRFKISVSNTGYLNRSLTKKIFSPGFSSKQGKHQGMGLYSVNRTVEKHGGSVEVTSQNGLTTFFVTLPKSRRNSC